MPWASPSGSSRYARIINRRWNTCSNSAVKNKMSDAHLSQRSSPTPSSKSCSRRSHRSTMMLLCLGFIILLILYWRTCDLTAGATTPRPCYVERGDVYAENDERMRESNCHPVRIAPLSMPQCARNIFESEAIRLEINNEGLGVAADMHGTDIDEASRAAGIDHMFVIHYTPNRERYANFVELLSTHKYRAEFITSFDRESLTPVITDSIELLLKEESRAYSRSGVAATGECVCALTTAAAGAASCAAAALHDIENSALMRGYVSADDVRLSELTFASSLHAMQTEAAHATQQDAQTGIRLRCTAIREDTAVGTEGSYDSEQMKLKRPDAYAHNPTAAFLSDLVSL